MSKILHSFTLDKKSSDLIKENSRPKEMSKQVSKAHGSVLASGQERFRYEKIITAYMIQIDELRLECETLRNNRFKFWKKTP